MQSYSKHRFNRHKHCVSERKKSKRANNFQIVFLQWSVTVNVSAVMSGWSHMTHTECLTSSNFLSSSHLVCYSSPRETLVCSTYSLQADRSRVWACFASWRARGSVSGGPARVSCPPVSSSLFSPARSGVQNASNWATSFSFSPTTRMWKWGEW